jgi:multiple sugar transport system ATP-binding protein
MGMETMIYMTLNGAEVCARVSPAAAGSPGETMRFTADLRHMHLIDPANDRVIAVPPDCRGDVRLNGDVQRLRVG